MKTDIHPNYVETTVHCSCGNTFTTRSTTRRRAAPRALQRVPPVLHRQAEAGRHRWPRRALQQALRRAQDQVSKNCDHHAASVAPPRRVAGRGVSLRCGALGRRWRRDWSGWCADSGWSDSGVRVRLRCAGRTPRGRRRGSGRRWVRCGSSRYGRSAMADRSRRLQLLAMKLAALARDHGAADVRAGAGGVRRRRGAARRDAGLGAGRRRAGARSRPGDRLDDPPRRHRAAARRRGGRPACWPGGPRRSTCRSRCGTPPSGRCCRRSPSRSRRRSVLPAAHDAFRDADRGGRGDAGGRARRARRRGRRARGVSGRDRSGHRRAPPGGRHRRPRPRGVPAAPRRSTDGRGTHRLRRLRAPAPRARRPRPPAQPPGPRPRAARPADRAAGAHRGHRR